SAGSPRPRRRPGSSPLRAHPAGERGAGSWLRRDRQLVPLRLERRHEARLLYRLHVGLVGADLFLLDELEQRVVQRHHAELLRGLHDRRDLEGLAFPDQVGHRRGREQDLARRPDCKLSVCTPTCRCVMRHFLFSCTNSIGSSIVMMWSVRIRFTRSTSPHRVVDFPEPVGPVTSTRPFVRKQSCCTSLVMPSCSTETTCAGITRNTASGPLRSRAAFTRKRASPAISSAESESPVSFHSVRFRSGILASSIPSSW